MEANSLHMHTVLYPIYQRWLKGNKDTKRKRREFMASIGKHYAEEKTTPTGREVSNTPNLQNITVKTDDGGRIRKALRGSR